MGELRTIQEVTLLSCQNYADYTYETECAKDFHEEHQLVEAAIVEAIDDSSIVRTGLTGYFAELRQANYDEAIHTLYAGIALRKGQAIASEHKDLLYDAALQEDTERADGSTTNSTKPYNSVSGYSPIETTDELGTQSHHNYTEYRKAIQDMPPETETRRMVEEDMNEALQDGSLALTGPTIYLRGHREYSYAEAEKQARATIALQQGVRLYTEYRELFYETALAEDTVRATTDSK